MQISSTTLVNITISDLPACEIKTERVSGTLFADDLVLWLFLLTTQEPATLHQYERSPKHSCNMGKR